MKKILIVALVGTMFSAVAMEKQVDVIKEDFEKMEIKSTLAFGTDENTIPFVVELKTIHGETMMSAKLDAVSYCITNQSQIEFVLDDGNKVVMTNKNGIHCGSNSMFVFLLTDKQKETLKKSPVKSITMKTDSGRIDLTNIKDPAFFVAKLE